MASQNESHPGSKPVRHKSACKEAERGTGKPVIFGELRGQHIRKERATDGRLAYHIKCEECGIQRPIGATRIDFAASEARRMGCRRINQKTLCETCARSITQMPKAMARPVNQGRRADAARRVGVNHTDRLKEIQRDPVAALYRFADRCGYGPQRHQLVAVVLAAVSPAANAPINEQLVGEFSDGKSTVARAAMKLVGPDFVATSSSVQRLTPAAFSRMATKLTGHAVFYDERHRSDSEFEALLRMVASGQRACRTITVRGEAVELIIEPPIAIIDLMLFDIPVSLQTRSRYWRIRMGSSQSIRDAISALSLEQYTLPGIRRKTEADEFSRSFQVFLASLARNIRVIVPFADQLLIKTTSRLRDRLMNNFLNCVCTVAWLGQHHRSSQRDGNRDYLIATADDYRVVHDIVLACCDDGSDGELPDNALTLFRLWSAWVEDHGNQSLTRRQVEGIVQGVLSGWQCYRALRELADAGYASGPKGRGQLGHWQLTPLGLASQHPNLFQLLPCAREIARPAQKRKPSD